MDALCYKGHMRRKIEQAAMRKMRAMVVRLVPGARIIYPRDTHGGWDILSRTDKDYTWDGQTLRPSGKNIESWSHDIAHILVAPRERRTLVECGIGPDPYRYSDAKCVVPRNVAFDEELIACYLQMILCVLLDLAVHEAADEVSSPLPTLRCLAAARAYAPDALVDEQWTAAASKVRLFNRRERTGRLRRVFQMHRADLERADMLKRLIEQKASTA